MDKKYIEFNDPAFSCYLATNNEYLDTEFYYGYSSPKKPSSIFKEDIESGKGELAWQQPVNNYDENLYEVERIKITARDETKVPVSLVYKKGTNLSHAPILIYGYGSYGATIEPEFDVFIPSLLDRGFVYCVGHIRGGGIKGHKGYEGGKLLNKINLKNYQI